MATELDTVHYLCDQAGLGERLTFRKMFGEYALYVDGKVVASMIRKAAPGEFRSNLHRGGSAEKVKLSPEERSIAVRSAKALGLRVAGVDILRSNHGPLVMEVNASPGLEGIEKATGKDVAGKVVELVEELVQRGTAKNRPQG